VKADAISKNGVLEFVGCADRGLSFGLEMAWVRSVQRADSLVRQKGPWGAVGVLHEGASELPAFRLSALVDPRHTSDANASHLIILHGEPNPFGFLVDDFWPITRISENAVFPLPSLVAELCGPHCRGILRLAGEPALWLSPEGLVPGYRPMRVVRGGLEESNAEDDLAPRSPDPIEPRRTKGNQIVIFSTVEVDGRNRPISFGLAISHVLEIIDLEPILPIPGAPDYLLGVTLWRGRALPVIDLPRRLGLGHASVGPRARLLIARATAHSEPMAFPIEPPIRVRRLPLAHVPCAKLPPLIPSLARGAVELNDQTLVIPDLASVGGA
jgi:purine-binding chemotaxis protein CheW